MARITPLLYILAQISPKFQIRSVSQVIEYSDLDFPLTGRHGPRAKRPGCDGSCWRCSFLPTENTKNTLSGEGEMREGLATRFWHSGETKVILRRTIHRSYFVVGKCLFGWHWLDAVPRRRANAFLWGQRLAFIIAIQLAVDVNASADGWGRWPHPSHLPQFYGNLPVSSPSAALSPPHLALALTALEWAGYNVSVRGR